MKKIIVICMAMLLIITGCSLSVEKNNDIIDDALPTPTVSPKITKPEGQFHDTEPPLMEGVVVAIDKKTITLKIEDTDYVLTLSDRAKEEISIYKDKFDTPIKPGMYMQIKYEEADSGYIANNLLFLESN